MPPQPRDVYNPVPEVSPSLSSGNDYLNIRATPDAFGAQVGEAGEKLGQTLEQTGDTAANVALQRQGMINETLATNAETDSKMQYGNILGKYKSLEGLSAVAQQDKAEQDIIATRQQIAATLPNDAARQAFTKLALRNEGYALQDVRMYAATQVKQADTQSAHASMTTAIASAGDLSVASDDKRFNQTLQDSDFAMNRIMANQGYGPDGGTGWKQDPKTGTVSFDESTPQGQTAKAIYTQMQDQAHGMAWESRLHVLADQNVMAAYTKYQDNRDQIPGEAQVKLDAYFTPKIRAAQASHTADSVLWQSERDFQGTVSGIAAGQPPTSSIADAIKTQESGGRDIPNAMQIQPGTWAQYAKPGEDINNKADNDNVGNRIIDDLTKKFGNDPARIAVGYFSGPGNVAPAGSPTPWVNDLKDANGKSVSSYVSDVTGRVAQGSQIQTRADFYRTNYASIIDQARQQADKDHPDDPLYAQQATARVEQRLNDVIRQQDLSHKADSDMVYQAFNGDLTKGQRPTTIDQLTAINPGVRDAWNRMQADNPQAALAVETRILTANAKAQGHDLNTYGPGYFNALRNINAAPGDPNLISDPTELWNRVGEDGDLTTAGVEQLTKIMGSKGTPEGESTAKMEQGALTMIKAHLSGEDLIGGQGAGAQKDPKGEEIFQHALPLIYQAIDAGKAKGLTPAQLYDPESQNFVGKAVMGFQRSPAQYAADLVNANTGGFEDYMTRDTLRADVAAGKVTKEQGIAEALKRGWIQAPVAAPAAPAGPQAAVEPQVPIVGANP